MTGRAASAGRSASIWPRDGLDAERRGADARRRRQAPAARTTAPGAIHVGPDPHAATRLAGPLGGEHRQAGHSSAPRRRADAASAATRRWATTRRRRKRSARRVRRGAHRLRPRTAGIEPARRGRRPPGAAARARAAAAPLVAGRARATPHGASPTSMPVSSRERGGERREGGEAGAPQRQPRARVARRPRPRSTPAAAADASPPSAPRSTSRTERPRARELARDRAADDAAADHEDVGRVRHASAAQRGLEVRQQRARSRPRCRGRPTFRIGAFAFLLIATTMPGATEADQVLHCAADAERRRRAAARSTRPVRPTWCCCGSQPASVTSRVAATPAPSRAASASDRRQPVRPADPAPDAEHERRRLERAPAVVVERPRRRRRARAHGTDRHGERLDHHRPGGIGPRGRQHARAHRRHLGPRVRQDRRDDGAAERRLHAAARGPRRRRPARSRRR